MFTEALNQKEKLGIAKLLAFVSAMDGKIEPSEREYVEGFLARAGLEQTDIWGLALRGSLEQICQTLATRRAKIIAMMELTAAAYADDEFAPEERAGLDTIARQLQLEPELLAEIEAWVEEGRDWQRRGAALAGLLGKS